MTTLNTLETIPSKPTTRTQTRLTGGWLWAARAAYAMIVLLVITMLVLGAPLRFKSLSTPCIPEQCESLHLSIEGAQTLKQSLGITPLAFGILISVSESLIALIFVLSGVVIAWRKSDDWMALFSAAALSIAGLGLMAFLQTLVLQMPVFTIPILLVRSLGFPLLALLFYLFPNGRFTPRWLRWPASIAAGLAVFVGFRYGFFSRPGLPLMAIVFAGGVFSQIYRYRKVSSPTERQQTKWIIVGFMIYFVGLAIVTVLLLLWPINIGPSGTVVIRTLSDFVLTVPLAIIFNFLPLSLIPVTFAISSLRFGLWDVDPILNRSLVYGGLTVLLAAVFAGVFFAMRALLGVVLGGDQGLIAAVLPTALVVGLFTPARRWLRRLVDRRLYGIQVSYATPPGHTTSQAGLTRTQLGQYTGLQPIGGGGMADVYRAEHPTLNRPVAVKMLPARLAANEELRRRFVREAQTVAVLKHPNIVQMFDFGEIEGIPYMVMEFIDGPTLSEYLRQCGQLSLDETGAILSEVSSALDYAHGQGLVHRDIKPGNVMLEGKPPLSVAERGTGSEVRAVLMDFGIAKVAQAATRLTHTGVMGTFDYMSPEQIQEAADVDGRADVYALGIMTYQMLTGELPFKHNSAGALLIAHLNQPAPDPRTIRPDLPQGTAEAILKAMEKQRERRFPSAGAFAAALH